MIFSRAAALFRLVQEAYPMMRIVALQGGSVFAKQWIDRAEAMGVKNEEPNVKADLPDDGA